MPDQDKQFTQYFIIKHTLINYCGEKLTPDLIDDILEKIKDEMRTGSCSWAFK